jgi:hypothetical protein
VRFATATMDLPAEGTQERDQHIPADSFHLGVPKGQHQESAAEVLG